MYIGSKVVVVLNLNLQPRRPVAEQFSRFKIINIDFLTFSIKKELNGQKRDWIGGHKYVFDTFAK